MHILGTLLSIEMEPFGGLWYIVPEIRVVSYYCHEMIPTIETWQTTPRAPAARTQSAIVLRNRRSRCSTVHTFSLRRHTATEAVALFSRPPVWLFWTHTFSRDNFSVMNVIPRDCLNRSIVAWNVGHLISGIQLSVFIEGTIGFSANRPRHVAFD